MTSPTWFAAAAAGAATPTAAIRRSARRSISLNTASWRRATSASVASVAPSAASIRTSTRSVSPIVVNDPVTTASARAVRAIVRPSSASVIATALIPDDRPRPVISMFGRPFCIHAIDWSADALANGSSTRRFRPGSFDQRGARGPRRASAITATRTMTAAAKGR